MISVLMFGFNEHKYHYKNGSQYKASELIPYILSSNLALLSSSFFFFSGSPNSVFQQKKYIVKQDAR